MNTFPELSVFSWVRLLWMDGPNQDEPVVTVGILVDEDEFYYYIVDSVAIDNESPVYDPECVEIYPKDLVKEFSELEELLTFHYPELILTEEDLIGTPTTKSSLTSEEINLIIKRL